MMGSLSCAGGLNIGLASMPTMVMEQPIKNKATNNERHNYKWTQKWPKMVGNYGNQ